ncbi:histidine kinase [Nostocales cyanobacterium HT-58-2]|nr:histidine kinase [Nostocales cyanobacterium HT-58-2]
MFSSRSMHLQNCPEFKLFLEYAPAAIAMFDREMRYIAASRRWLKNFGFIQGSLTDCYHYEVFPGTSEKWKAVHERCLTGYAESGEADSIVQSDGSLEWVKWESNPWYTQDGDIGGTIFFFEKISERKPLEPSLLEGSKEDFQKLAANLPGDIYQEDNYQVRFRELAEREKLLNRVANQIRHSLDLDTVIETAIQEIQKLLQIDRCNFCWYKPDVDPPIWEAIKEEKNPNLPSLLGFYPATVVGSVTQQLLNQEIIRIDNVADLSDSIHRQFLQALGFQSEIVLPLKTLSGEIGIVVCGHCTHPRPWKDSEVELLQAVISQLAIAINQALPYTQAHHAAITAQNQALQLEKTLEQLETTQNQLLQSEKMSSLGHLLAGVAHEINNPVNFIFGNLVHASGYIEDLLGLLKLYQQTYPEATPEIREEMDAIDLDFLILDLPKLLSSMKVGADRIREIVRSLRIFSRHDEAQMEAVDIHEGIDSTLMILQSRLKYSPVHSGIEVIKNYGHLPLIECHAGQINQAFMNLLANAIDALEEHWSKDNFAIKNSQLAMSATPYLRHNSLKESKILVPQIHIRTEVLDNGCIAIHIIDNGPGMTSEVQKRLFEPFFTTKPIGVGTGLGLSISHQIVVEKHCGKLLCFSEPGKGTEFVLEIPILQSKNNITCGAKL